jgi:hypothetical protein
MLRGMGDPQSSAEAYRIIGAVKSNAAKVYFIMA